MTQRLVAVGVTAADGGWVVRTDPTWYSDGFPDLSAADIDAIFGRTSENELTAREEADFQHGFDSFVDPTVNPDDLSGFQLLGWLEAQIAFESNCAEGRAMVAQMWGPQ